MGIPKLPSLLAGTPFRPWQLLLAAALLAHVVSAATAASNEATGYAAWPKWVLVVFCLSTVVLSAMYCGLTIGLLGMETIYLEIIADAGQEPDKTYAKKILPVRKLGHQLLSTLLLGNMLTLVLTSQLVAAIVQGSEIVNFVLGTLVVLLFGEIIPMSFCNNQNNALLAGAKSITALKISLFVLWPVAKPLGLMLDCMVGHDAGLVYDRAEMKKLIRMHCEKFSDKSGIDMDQVRMMLSAMDMNEVTVDAAMTPMEKAVMVEADAVLDAAVERRLWEHGISRIPVYEGTRDNVIGVLYVKDLINMSHMGRDANVTVREFVEQHPRDVLVVKANTLLQDMLYIFEHRHTQLLFVESDVGGESTPAPNEHPEVLPVPRRSRANTPRVGERAAHGGGGEAGETAHVVPVIITPRALKTDGTRRHTLVGIVTLEDVIESLIGSEIYDEDEYSLTGEGEEEMFEVGALEPAPTRPPRVNFYSYGVETTADGGDSKLYDDQLWALASYLTRSYVYFATWSVPHVKFLLDQVGDRVVRVDAPEMEGSDMGSRNSAVLTAVLQRDLRTVDPSRVLYTAGQPTTAFTLLLSGGVAVSVGRERITTELRSFSELGEEVLLSDSPFQPDYTAIVSRTSRLIRITQQDIATAERRLNELRARRRQKPVRLSPAAKVEVRVPASSSTPPQRTGGNPMRGEDRRVVIDG